MQDLGTLEEKYLCKWLKHSYTTLATHKEALAAFELIDPPSACYSLVCDTASWFPLGASR